MNLQDWDEESALDDTPEVVRMHLSGFGCAGRLTRKQIVERVQDQTGELRDLVFLELKTLCPKLKWATKQDFWSDTENLIELLVKSMQGPRLREADRSAIILLANFGCLSKVTDEQRDNIAKRIVCENGDEQQIVFGELKKLFPRVAWSTKQEF